MRGNSFKSILLASALAGGVVATQAAPLAVMSGGLGPLTFDAAPVVGEIGTGVLVGVGTTYGSCASLDTKIQTMDKTALPFFIALSTVSEAAPATFAGGMRYNSLNKYLQSRPTTSGTNAAGYMVATLVNQTGGNMSDFDVRYDLTAGAAAAVDDCAGFRVFISPNGSPNSWVAITGLDKNITAGPQSGNVLLAPPIANNQTFYLLWVDDNDDGDTDPAYTIDNLAIVFANQPPVVSSSPANQTVAEGSTLVMSVVASGATSYKWFKGAVEVVNGTTCINGGDKVISGATSASLTIANAKPADSGVYHAQAFNGVGNALSANATLTVNKDTNCPVILYVYPGANNNQFVVHFSKPMDDDCAGTGAITDYLVSYTIEDIGGGSLGVSGITNLLSFKGQTVLGLTTSIAHNPALPFKLTVNVALSDTSETQLSLPAGTTKTVTPLLALNHTWSFDDSDTDLGPMWFTADPTGPVNTGPGPFDAKRQTVEPHCRAATLYELGNVGTCINIKSVTNGTVNLVTTYFWTHFNTPAAVNLANVDLFLIGKADDGILFYLNGNEEGRLRMAAGAVNHFTLSSAGVGDADARDRLLLTLPNGLHHGDNLAAAAIHQTALTSSDVTFGFQVYSVEPSLGAKVSVSVNGLGQPVVSWRGGTGGHLEGKTNLEDPTWTDLGTANPFTDLSGLPHRFFRVRVVCP